MKFSARKKITKNEHFNDRGSKLIILYNSIDVFSGGVVYDLGWERRETNALGDIMQNYARKK